MPGPLTRRHLSYLILSCYLLSSIDEIREIDNLSLIFYPGRPVFPPAVARTRKRWVAKRWVACDAARSLLPPERKCATGPLANTSSTTTTTTKTTRSQPLRSQPPSCSKQAAHGGAMHTTPNACLSIPRGTSSSYRRTAGSRCNLWMKTISTLPTAKRWNWMVTSLHAARLAQCSWVWTCPRDLTSRRGW